MTSKEERLFILERDNWTCQYCGAPARHRDHVFPGRLEIQCREAGIDINSLENSVASCVPCNLVKYVSTWVPESWADRIPELKKQLPGHEWKVFCGESASEMDRKVAA